jgi:hypothetical protein
MGLVGLNTAANDVKLFNLKAWTVVSRKCRGESGCSFRGMLGKLLIPHGALSELVIVNVRKIGRRSQIANRQKNRERNYKIGI